MKLNELALFAGVGGGLLASELLGWRTVCAVEVNPYRIATIAGKQNAGILRPFPIWDDVRTFPGANFRGYVDIVSGGFPCQAYSTAHHGESTAIDFWPDMRRIIGEVRPRLVFAENVSIKAIGKAAAELGHTCDGFRTEIIHLSGSDIGGIQRSRYWLLAYTDLCSELLSRFNVQTRIMSELHPVLVQPDSSNRQRTKTAKTIPSSQRCEETRLLGETKSATPWLSSRPETLGMDDGVAYRMERLNAIGDGQIPAVAAVAFLVLATRVFNKIKSGE